MSYMHVHCLALIGNSAQLQLQVQYGSLEITLISFEKLMHFLGILITNEVFQSNSISQ